MVDKETMIKGLDSLEALCESQNNMRRDGLIYLFELGKWEDFMTYHCKKEMERTLPKEAAK